MDDNEGKVNDLLEQCVDHAALRVSTGPSDALDADLLARLQRLKAAPQAPEPAPTPHVDSDGLQFDLAERLAALKTNPSKAYAPDIVETSKISNPHRIAHYMPEGYAVQKLLESVQDSVRLEKSSMPEHIRDWVPLEKSGASGSNQSDEEVSESEVDHIVEWAKDAAALEEEEDDASDVELPTTPPSAHNPPPKKKSNRWKFW